MNWDQGDVDVVHDRVCDLLALAPPGAVVAGISAARLHGLWLPAPKSDEPLELILRADAGDQRAHAGTRRTQLRGRRRHVSPDQIVSWQSLRITSVARTWVDLAQTLDAPSLVAAGDCALRGSVAPADLIDAVRIAGGQRGVVRARAVLPHLDPRSRSRPESHLRFALVSRGLPAPRVNVPVFTAQGEWLAEPDLSYDDVQLAIEYNGADHADVSRMRRDITRTLDLEERGGWRTVTFGPAQVFRHPAQVAAFVSVLRRSRAARAASAARAA